MPSTGAPLWHRNEPDPEKVRVPLIPQSRATPANPEWRAFVLSIPTLSDEAFLRGPRRTDDAEIEIDDILGKTLRDAWGDMIQWGQDEIDLTGEGWESDVAPGYRYVGLSGGILLVAPDNSIAGGYLGLDVAIMPRHQGLGLGAELILEKAIRDGIPTWEVDTPGYTHAGRAAHIAARDLARNPEIFLKKIRRIGVEPDQDPTPDFN